MPESCVQVAQAIVSGADGGEFVGMMLRRKLSHQFQIALPDRIVIAFRRQTQNCVRIIHRAPHPPALPAVIEILIIVVVVHPKICHVEQIAEKARRPRAEHLDRFFPRPDGFE